MFDYRGHQRGTRRLSDPAATLGPVTPLEQLVDGAAGDTVPVSTLLRQLKVIAARTDTTPLADWVRHELEGYPSRETVPTYRGPFDVEVYGSFLGIMNSRLDNVPIPRRTAPAEWRSDHLFTVVLTDPVAELEQMARQEHLSLAWPADVVRAYNGLVAAGRIRRIVREDFVLGQALRYLPGSTIVGALDIVRTRILDLALELEKVAPAAGQSDAPSETASAAQQVITNHFHGTVGNLAIASDGASQAVTVQLPGPGDEAGLLRYLGAHGVDPARLVALREALEQDREEAGGEQPLTAGSRVRTWLAQAGTDVATNTTSNVLASATPGIIVAAISAFFGG